MRFLIAAAIFLSSPAMAQGPMPQSKLQLNDIPSVLNKMMECEVSQSWAGRPMKTCKYEKSWVSVGANGEIIIFYKGGAGLEANGSGPTIEIALQNLAAKLNAIGGDAKRAVGAMSEFLPGN